MGASTYLDIPLLLRMVFHLFRETETCISCLSWLPLVSQTLMIRAPMPLRPADSWVSLGASWQEKVEFQRDSVWMLQTSGVKITSLRDAALSPAFLMGKKNNLPTNRTSTGELIAGFLVQPSTVFLFDIPWSVDDTLQEINISPW